jgi:predicted lysophospholipase L1 biosynthesis ABC-type transport system permease subunit
MMGQISDDTLHQMSNAVGASEPISVETISSSGAHNLQTGDGNSRIVLEYGLSGRWVVADAVLRTQAASKRFTRLYFTVNTLPLREINAFHLLGKGPAQYLFLAGWIAVIAFTALAISAAFRRHTGWRRWALIFLMPLGLTPTVAVNWNTAQMWVLEAISNPAGHVIPLFALRWPMALFSYTETRAPFLYVSVPLIAFGYLIWYWRLSQRRPPLASSADQAS